MLCPLPTMRLHLADTSCHPSIQIPLISAMHTLTLRGRRRPELALSLRCTRIPTEEAKGPHGDPNRQSKGSSIKSGSVGTLGGKGRGGMNNIGEGEVTGRDRNRQWAGRGEDGGRNRLRYNEEREKEAAPGSLFV